MLKTTAAAGAAAATGAAFTGPALAQDDDLSGWFDNVSNFDGVEDHTGEDSVTIEVGVEANNGPYGFGPAAVRVDPGTEVTWEWVEGNHDVVAEDGSYESELTDETGFTFTQTFDEEGTVRYACTPHQSMGMKGAVVVGGVDVGLEDSSGSSEGGDSAAEDVDFDGWFDNVDNFDGVEDHTGEDSVTVEVGTDANGGPYGFTPPAVRVDPGTEVTFEWVEGTHNVVAEDGSYESELTDETGFTFTQTYEEEGVSKYYCEPHRTMGMKGAVVVGSGGGGGSQSGGGGGLSNSDIGVLAFAGALVGGLLSPFALRATRSSSNAPSNRR